jgi:hypothetical protein
LEGREVIPHHWSFAAKKQSRRDRVSRQKKSPIARALFLHAEGFPLALFVALAGFLLAALLTGLALLAALALLLTGLLAGALLVLVFLLLLAFLARLLVLVHWSSDEGVCPSLLTQPLPSAMVPAEPYGSKGFFVYFRTFAQSCGVPDFAPATSLFAIN